MPAVLKRLMRHADISTTMGYYVELDADEVAGDLWAKFGNNPGNSGQKGQDSPVRAGDSKSDAENGYEVGPAGFEPATKGL